MSAKREGPMLHELEAAAKATGRAIAETCPPGVGFCLMMFTFGDAPGWSTFLSNAERSTMIQGVEELLARLKANGATDAR